MTLADEYIQKFKELEAVVKENFGLKDWDSVTNFLSKQDEFRPFREEIKYCQEVRNLLQHKQKISGEYPVQPSREMINFLEKTIAAVKNRKKCSEIMVPKAAMFWKGPEDKIGETLPKMKNASYSHVPILDGNGKIAGVFTLFSFFNMAAEQKIEDVRSTNFEKAKKYIALNYHRTETYCFVSKNRFVDELKDLFEKTYSGGKRLSMVFVTENGKAEEKILGIISPWDVLGKE